MKVSRCGRPGAPTYDANGNLTSDGSNSFTYDAENHLTSVSGAHTATLSYDPLGRLWQISAPSATTRFIYDGDHEITETDGSGNFQREFIWGPGADEPLVQWDNAGPKMLHADERGSIISLADTNGNLIATNSYDEYGTPASANQGRFQYTGQAWLSEIGLYYYKARMYSPTLGRFMQTDPIGYDDGPNWYAYAHNDPVNLVDPLGFHCDENTTVCGHRLNLPGCNNSSTSAVCGGSTTSSPSPSAPGGGPSGQPGKQPQNPDKKQVCSRLQKAAAAVGNQLQTVSEDFADIALGGAVATLISTGGEVFTLGADTPVTITAATITEFAGSASLVTGGMAAALESYSAGNNAAIDRFDANALTTRTIELAVQKFGPTAKFASVITGLTDKAENIIESEQKNGCNER